MKHKTIPVFGESGRLALMLRSYAIIRWDLIVL
jgi:hypothetical protein